MFSFVAWYTTAWLIRPQATADSGVAVKIMGRQTRPALWNTSY